MGRTIPRLLIVLALASLVFVDVLHAQDARRAPVPAHPRLGTNLSGPADWNTELPFVDVFRMSRPWISQREGAGWGKGPPLALDENGYVTRLEPGCFAETLVCTIEGGHYPSGRYTLLYDGEGEIDVVHAGRIIERGPGRLVVEIDASRGNPFIRLLKTNPDNHVRNIRMIMPGFEATFERDPFHPAFLDRWRGVACLRFMDWMQTNDSTISTWNERPQLDDATWSERGIPLEVMIDLGNRLQADPWFCMPHKADDDYVRRFAEMVKERLDPGLTVYVEYSNEVWNGQFQQHRYAADQGIALKIGRAQAPWESAWHYTARRSVEIFRIWEDAFGGHDRLVRVLPSQAANAYVSEQILRFEDAYEHADALAIAPYVGLNVPAAQHAAGHEGPTTADVEKWTVEQALDYLEDKSLPQTTQWIGEQKAMADKYGVKLVAYEAGQHMVGVMGGENNERVTKLFHASNAHPRMGAIYDKYLAAWSDTGGDLLCNFSSVGNWSKWGSWGVLQFYDGEPAQSPKYMSIMRWARQQGQDVNVPAASE